MNYAEVITDYRKASAVLQITKRLIYKNISLLKYLTYISLLQTSDMYVSNDAGRDKNQQLPFFY
jgi:hypothetical protein